MGSLLALASAACYGIADFTGGLLSRRVNFALVALAGQAGGLALTSAAALFLPEASPTAADLAWGALSGVGTGVGMVFLFRGLSRGAMSVVVPVSAVGGVALPVLVGVALLGDRPSALSWLGILTAVPALWLVSHTGPGSAPDATRASLDGLIAGSGIALQYVALAQSAPAAGIWPVTAGRVTALVSILPVVLVPLCTRRRARRREHSHAQPGPPRPRPFPPSSRMPARYAAGAASTGMVAALALVLYLLATREDLVVVAVVLSSLYPVLPVLLGLTVLRERPTRPQIAGLLGAAAAVALLTAG
ncbi:MAG TPA: DMT family transporter [Streptomyces sp.]|jgi:drug/metabolite transporter (DMT)-like permease|nr:DMT family transporter [Streptomyces sp.]